MPKLKIPEFRKVKRNPGVYGGLQGEARRIHLLQVDSGSTHLNGALRGPRQMAIGMTLGYSGCLMLTLIEIGIMRIFEVVFFAGIAGCVVTILTSWYSIIKELAD